MTPPAGPAGRTSWWPSRAGVGREPAARRRTGHDGNKRRRAPDRGPGKGSSGARQMAWFHLMLLHLGSVSCFPVRSVPDVAFSTACSAAPFIIRPGINRLAVTVLTTYQSCTQAAGRATSSLPACPHGRQLMPSLPSGRYEAVLVGSGLPLPAPAPVPVNLSVPAASRTSVTS
jgi:hypothetical protein